MSFNDYWQAEQRRRAVAEAIAALKPGDGAAQARFFEALKQAALLVPVAELPPGLESGELFSGQSGQLRVTMVAGPDGKAYLPAFTTESHLHRGYPTECPYLMFLFPAIANMVVGARVEGIIIDREGPVPAIVHAAMLQALASGQGGQQGPAGERPRGTTATAPTQLRLGSPPRVVHYGEIAALHDWLERQPGLAQAYLFGLVQDEQRVLLSLGLGFLAPPDQGRLNEMVREVTGLLGPTGLLLLDGQLAALLARQPGVIRFDLHP